MHEEYRKENENFVEKQPRLLFFSFLKSVISGIGFYYVEPQTGNNHPMDLIVTYDGKEFIMELKIWRGEKFETEKKQQVSEYLQTHGKDKGYWVTFSFVKTKKIE